MGTGVLHPDLAKKKKGGGPGLLRWGDTLLDPPSLPGVGRRDRDLRSQLAADGPVLGESTTSWRA